MTRRELRPEALKRRLAILLKNGWQTWVRQQRAAEAENGVHHEGMALGIVGCTARPQLRGATEFFPGPA
jgi:hypothetical protein